MPDAGDDAGDVILGLIKDTVERLPRDLKEKKLNHGSKKAQRAAKRSARKEKIEQQIFNLEERADKALDAIQPHTDTLVTNAKQASCEMAFAADYEELEFLCEELDKAKIEHCFSLEDTNIPEAQRKGLESVKPNQDGMYEIYLPDREPDVSIHAPFSKVDHSLIDSRKGYVLLSNMDDELRALINEHFSADAVAQRVATSRACAQAGQETAPPRFRSTQPDFQLNFETVTWDPQANILCDNLERLGIPFTPVKNDATSIAVNIPAEYTPEVKELADYMVSQENYGIAPTRFINYEELSKVVEEVQNEPEIAEPAVVQTQQQISNPERYIERAVADENVFKQVTSSLEQNDVPFTAWKNEEGYHIAMRENEAQQSLDNMQRAATQARQQQQQLTQDKKRKAVDNAKNNACKTNAPRPRREQNTPTPTRDAERARKAARLYTTNRKRTQSRSR